ncbi:MAG: hypothetical protein PHF86_03105 [Candidatus Nanoarchaeia archaeon]|jgi:hypothetical protein|nr:hypothetical protein [Candidatus Nanoarchaeia archaeon]
MTKEKVTNNFCKSEQQIKVNDCLYLITYKSGDNPIICKKENFDINLSPVSESCSIFEITINKVFEIKRTLSLVEKK